MPVSPLIFALLVVSQKRGFFKTEGVGLVFVPILPRYEIMVFAFQARALSKYKHLALSARALVRRYIRNVGSEWSVFRVFLQEIYGKKRPEKSEDYFSVSNSYFRTAPYICYARSISISHEQFRVYTNRIETCRKCLNVGGYAEILP